MRAWSDYAARGQALLQEGRPCAQALLLLGDGSPNRLPPHQMAELRRDGRTFDLCSAADLPSLRPGPGGTILADAAPDGDAPPPAPYALVWLGADPWLTLDSLRHLRRLAEGGARVTGSRPIGSPSLADDPAAWRAECDAPPRTRGHGRQRLAQPADRRRRRARRGRGRAPLAARPVAALGRTRGSAAARPPHLVEPRGVGRLRRASPRRPARPGAPPRAAPCGRTLTGAPAHKPLACEGADW